MPRLSLYKPEKGLDYKFIDRQCSEMFQVGGTDAYIHKYMGSNTDPANATADQPAYNSVAVTNIQDLLFLENRDRKYDPEIYRIRCMYNVANIDFNMSQFGLFIDNDTLFMTVHINDFIKYVGRKPLTGDVIELPHLRDDFALNDFDISLPRYYVIEDVGRASEGFSVTWFPHLYRLKLKKITDSQQFSDIMGQNVKDANGDEVAGTTLKDLLSTYNQEIAINNQVIQQAEADAPKSGYETRQFYTLAVDATGKAVLETADDMDVDASNMSSTITAAGEDGVPVRTGYTGYLVGDGYPQNGYDFGFGIQFPSLPESNDFFLRTDFMPNRLFRYDGKANTWIKVEDSVRMNMTNNDTRNTQKTGFINNTNWTYNDKVGEDTVALAKDATVINTRIDYITAAYVVLKFQTVTLEFVVADNVGMLFNNAGKLRITLPVIDTVQQTIPLAAAWSVALYNTRENERQSLSKALKPRADL